MRKSKIPTYDLFIEGQENPVLQGVHKTQANNVIAGLEKNGISYILIESKAIKSSKYNKHCKDREKFSQN